MFDTRIKNLKTAKKKIPLTVEGSDRSAAQTLNRSNDENNIFTMVSDNSSHINLGILSTCIGRVMQNPLFKSANPVLWLNLRLRSGWYLCLIFVFPQMITLKHLDTTQANKKDIFEQMAKTRPARRSLFNKNKLNTPADILGRLAQIIQLRWWIGKEWIKLFDNIDTTKFFLKLSSY